MQMNYQTTTPKEETMEKVRVLVVDEHVGFRKALTAFLESHHEVTVVGEVASEREALRMSQALNPDVILLGSEIAAADPFRLTAMLKEGSPETKIVILSIKTGLLYHMRAKMSGADAYIEKDGIKQPLRRFLSSVAERNLSTKSNLRMVAA